MLNRCLSACFRPLVCASLSLLLVACGSQSTGVSTTNQGPPEILYGAAAGALLNYFLTIAIDPNTGSLAFVPGAFYAALQACSGGIVAVNAQFLYISAPCSGQIFVYSLDAATGVPTEIAGSPFSLGTEPAALAALPGSSLLYAADKGGIDLFSIGANGTPAAVAGSPVAAEDIQQLVVDPSGKYLYATSDNGAGAVLAYAIGAGGSLSPVAGSPFVLPAENGVDNQPVAIVDTGTFVYTVLPGTGGIAGFSINSATGALTPVAGSPFSLTGPGGDLISIGGFLYATTQKGTIAGFKIDSASGALESVPGSPFGSNSGLLTADLSGKYLYDSTFDGIQGYNINPATGALTLGAGKIEGIDGALLMTVVQLPSTSAQQAERSAAR